MDALRLYLGTPARSSWSLRPWLLLRHYGIASDDRIIELQQPDSAARLRAVSPSGRVPVLEHGAVRVWESLAICEYLAETFALSAAWPAAREPRALARALACEMHAGFADLRRELPFDALRAPAASPRSAAADADIARIRALWRDARLRHGADGDWLFGRFGIVDAMYAPVALRLHAYAVPLDGIERDYVETVLSHPAIADWITLARDAAKPAGADAAPPKAEPAPAIEIVAVPTLPQSQPRTSTATPPPRLRSIQLPSD